MANQNTKNLRPILTIVILIVLIVTVALFVLTNNPTQVNSPATSAATNNPTQVHSPANSAANVQRILAELPDAQARWEKQSITDYDIDATMSIALSCAALPDSAPMTFHIRDGKAQQAGDFSNCERELVKLLPPAGFAGLENTLDQIDTNQYFLDVQFDEVYGFISKYTFECNDTSVSDCFARFEISNLRRVNR